MNSDFSWLEVSAEEAARRLLGCELVRKDSGGVIRVRIVETEAYDQADEASHTYAGRTKRNNTMFESAGHMYVYFTYGMHYCCNVVCGNSGYGSGVLIRAAEPLEGQSLIEKSRGMTGVGTTNGPGKLCQALGIDLNLNGHYLSEPPIELIKKPKLPDSEVSIGPRIGISKAVDELRRFYVTNNPYVSRYKLSGQNNKVV